MKNPLFAVIAATAVSGVLFSTSLVAQQPGGGTSSGRDAAANGGESGWRGAMARFGGVEADTRPSRDVVMRFGLSVEVRERMVSGGQAVKKGDVLLRARDADIRAAIDQQKLRAENDLEVQAAETDLALRDFRYQNVLEARSKGGSSPAELEERRIEREQARLALEQAKIRRTEQEITLRQFEGRYEGYRLEAPFDGIVEEVLVEVGQGVNEQMPAIRVVNTDQLWLDAYPTTDETLRLSLREGARAWVLLNLPDAPRLAEGKVLYVSPVADSVSQRRRVRVEIDNPAKWPAGTLAAVRFTAPAGEWPRADDALAASIGGGGSEAKR